VRGREQDHDYPVRGRKAETDTGLGGSGRLAVGCSRDQV
jgi:hypothetical protein